MKITICSLKELNLYKARQVTHVLSILDPGVTDQDVFKLYTSHHRVVQRFHDAIEPAPDVRLPQGSHVAEILAFGHDVREMAKERQGVHLLVHCHAGISRSTAASTMLLAQAYPNESADTLLSRVLKMRPKSWPNLRMLEFADVLLRREGTLLAAAGRVYRHQIDTRAGIADFMRRHGRGREVDLALRS